MPKFLIGRIVVILLFSLAFYFGIAGLKSGEIRSRGYKFNRDENLYQLTAGLALFRDNNALDWPRVLAASVMGSFPLILLFYAAQRHLVGGISLSGMKAQ